MERSATSPGACDQMFLECLVSDVSDAADHQVFFLQGELLILKEEEADLRFSSASPQGRGLCLGSGANTLMTNQVGCAGLQGSSFDSV